MDEWSNTNVLNEGLGAEALKMKRSCSPDIGILGSGSIVSRLTQDGLIDEFQIVVNPIVLGAGRTQFEGVKDKLGLALT